MIPISLQVTFGVCSQQAETSTFSTENTYGPVGLCLVFLSCPSTYTLLYLHEPQCNVLPPSMSSLQIVCLLELHNKNDIPDPKSHILTPCCNVNKAGYHVSVSAVHLDWPLKVTRTGPVSCTRPVPFRPAPTVPHTAAAHSDQPRPDLPRYRRRR